MSDNFYRSLNYLFLSFNIRHKGEMFSDVKAVEVIKPS